ncbi:peptidase domain-containing ABC transporter [Bacillus velezensis]|uniref:peptidase domain-containing ABC transporter n=1 Tax=Bacillus velezensis TaxID=492670 RepID=UPI003F75FF09
MIVKKKKRVPIVKQLQQTECGLCCCAMLIRFYNSNETLFELRSFLEAGRDGLTIKQLKNLLVHKGFKADIYKSTILGLKKINVPFIAYWNNEHFIVVEKIKENYYYIIDPANGRRKLTEEEFKKGFSSYILYAVPSESFTPNKRKDKNVWFGVLKNITNYKLLFSIIVFLSLISYLLTLYVPILVQKLIDTSIEYNNLNSISNIVWITFLISILYGMFVLFRGLKMISLNIFLSKNLVVDTFAHLLKLPFKFFDLRSPGDLLFRLNSMNGFRELLSTQLISGLIDLGAVVFILAYMFFKSIPLTLITILIFAINTVFMFLTRPAVAQAIDDEVAEQSKSQAIQIESIFSIAAIKISGMENEIFSTWNNSFNEVIKRFKKRSILQNVVNTVTQVFQTIAPLVILILELLLFFDNKFTMGEVIAYHSLSVTFFGLTTSLFGTYTQFILATSYLERVKDITETECEKNIENAVNLKLRRNVKLENVSFSYTKHSPKVLKNISLEIREGQKIAIVGSSGSGKSTLSKLIMGLYDPTEGQICFDSIPLEKLDRKQLYKQMGIVPQDITLFNSSILKNITLNNKNISVEKVRKVAKAAQIDKEIESMPMKYNTPISEMGMNLSGGQRQRIVLARALLNDPKILILDEATSSLDLVNESLISKYLSEMGCTRVVIAHRLSTIIDSDFIIVLDKGEVVESGKHEDLIALEGVYSNLYRSQTKKEKT